jgi:hypothetical protein
MSGLGIAVSWASIALALAALFGLTARRKTRASWLFAAYLLSVALAHGALLAPGGALWNWQFWAATDALQTLLCLGVAVEIGRKTFGALPQARRLLLLYFLFACIGIVVGVLLYPRVVVDAFELVLIVGWVSYGVAFLFVGLLVIALVYGVPLDPLHRAIAAGFALASAVLAFTHSLPAHADLGRAWLSKTSYPLILAFWTWAAWRRDDFTGMSAQAIARLWPWRQP